MYTYRYTFINQYNQYNINLRFQIIYIKLWFHIYHQLYDRHGPFEHAALRPGVWNIYTPGAGRRLARPQIDDRTVRSDWEGFNDGIYMGNIWEILPRGVSQKCKFWYDSICWKNSWDILGNISQSIPLGVWYDSILTGCWVNDWGFQSWFIACTWGAKCPMRTLRWQSRQKAETHIYIVRYQFLSYTSGKTAKHLGDIPLLRSWQVLWHDEKVKYRNQPGKPADPMLGISCTETWSLRIWFWIPKAWGPRGFFNWFCN